MSTPFNPYRSDGKLRSNLRRAFLEDREVEMGQHSIGLEDGSVFSLEMEQNLKDYLKRNGTAKALVSFQVGKDGTAIAIARLHNSQ